MMRMESTGEFSKWRKERWTTTRESHYCGTSAEQVLSSPGDRGIAFQHAAFQAVMQVFQGWITV